LFPKLRAFSEEIDAIRLGPVRGREVRAAKKESLESESDREDMHAMGGKRSLFITPQSGAKERH